MLEEVDFFLFTKNPNLKKKIFFLLVYWGGGGVGGGGEKGGRGKRQARVSEFLIY